MSSIYKIAVLLSTYNGEKYLREQIDSILAQTIKEKMLICVRDDGSTDGTINILRQYQLAGKLQYYVGTTLGPTKSFLQLLYNAPEAEYYAFSDQNDYWQPDKLEIALKMLEISNQDMPLVYCSKRKITDANLQPLEREEALPWMNTMDVLIRENYAFGCTMVLNNTLRTLVNLQPIPQIHMYDSYIYRLAILFGKALVDRIPHILCRQQAKSEINVTENQQKKSKIPSIASKVDKYKHNIEPSTYAKAIWQGYEAMLFGKNKEVVYNLAYLREDPRCRRRLFFKSGLSLFPLYEYFAYKTFIYLGWL